MSNISRSDVINMREKLQSVIDQAISERFPGMTCKVGNAKYGATNVEFKVELKQEGHDEAEVNQIMDLFGFTTKVASGGEELIGYRPKAQRYPFIVKFPGGREMCVTRWRADALFNPTNAIKTSLRSSLPGVTI